MEQYGPEMEQYGREMNMQYGPEMKQYGREMNMQYGPVFLLNGFTSHKRAKPKKQQKTPEL